MKRLLFSAALTLVCLVSNAQTFQVRDLKNAVGAWEGKLTYLDYSTGKPFSILANIHIGLTEDKKGFIMGYEYPKEPHANAKDTTYVTGKVFGKERIVDFSRDADGGFRFITEKDGEDGNDHKKALIRHTYLLKSTTLSIQKDVKFEGTASWIKRSEYLFNRVAR